MTAAPWPCSTCGEPGYKNIAAKGYCRRHLAELFATFDPAAFGLIGVGVQAGPMRPDHGPHDAELECVVCEARWVGELLDPCPYCARSVEKMLAWQAQLVLTPPDLEPTDVRYAAAARAWAERLARAVESGLIDAEQARRAWGKAVRRDAAA